MYTPPSVWRFKSMPSFLSALKEANAKNHSFSYRLLCLGLSFSPSLISDVVARRRKLPMPKALELAKFLNLDSNDKQYLLLLSQMDPADKEMAEFIDEISYPISNFV